ncbi:MAG TPA: PEP-CTERM sorting domain-containing protein [Opitutaceae bacterium]|nr:PEP-CTERM sorting domain-containing protein [Opitutaceae bacterium]
MKNNQTKFAGVALAALLASVGLSPSANAQLVLTYETTTSGHAIGESFNASGGEFVIKLFNFDMGTTYGSLGPVGTSVTGEGAVNGLAQTGATGAIGAEDSWGIAKVEGIFDSFGGRIWSETGKGQELTIMFYGARDFFVEQTSVGSQEIGSVGMHIDLYLQTIGGPGYTAYNPLLGSSGRGGLSSYSTVTDGTLILSTVSTPGFIFAPGTFGGAATEFRSNFNAGSGGLGETYLDVTGGSMATSFDTNGVSSVFNSGADLFAQFTTAIYRDNPASATDNWLVSSQDPVTGNLAAVPEPSTYGLVAAGALFGLVALRRMKKRASAV